MTHSARKYMSSLILGIRAYHSLALFTNREFRARTRNFQRSFLGRHSADGLVKTTSPDYDFETKGATSSQLLADVSAPETSVAVQVLSCNSEIGSPSRLRSCLSSAHFAWWTPLTAQDRSATPVPNTVWVGADGKFEAEPDTVLVQFNISAQEDKLPDANQKASRAADQVRQLLRSNGLDPKDAQVGRFSVQPVYDYKTPKRKLVGYRVETNISIKLKDFSKVGPITEGLGGHGRRDRRSIAQLSSRRYGCRQS